MIVLKVGIQWLGSFNAAVLAVGRGLGAIALALMVVIILAQVWYRYVLGNPLPWPDEAARFFMLWLTGLMAPTAFRRGGFVAINMFALLLPQRAQALLSLLLLLLSLAVLAMAAKIGWAEINGIGGKFSTASLKVPSLDFSTWHKVPRSWMMMSFHTGICLLLLVNVELILRALASLLGVRDVRPIAESVTEGATCCCLFSYRCS